MKVTEMSNLWVGYNKDEDFRVLICAEDKQEAVEIAASYRSDSDMGGKFEISEFDSADTHFDCDYVLCTESGMIR